MEKKKFLVIVGISLGIISVGIAFALVSNSDDAKIRELISVYQNMLNNEEIEKISTLYSEQAIFMPPEVSAIKGVEEIVLTYEYLFSQFDFELDFDIKEVVISVTSSIVDTKIFPSPKFPV